MGSAWPYTILSFPSNAPLHVEIRNKRFNPKVKKHSSLHSSAQYVCEIVATSWCHHHDNIVCEKGGSSSLPWNTQMLPSSASASGLIDRLSSPEPWETAPWWRQRDRHVGYQTDRQTDMQAFRQTGRQAGILQIFWLHVCISPHFARRYLRASYYTIKCEPSLERHWFWAISLKCGCTRSLLAFLVVWETDIKLLCSSCGSTWLVQLTEMSGTSNSGYFVCLSCKGYLNGSLVSNSTWRLTSIYPHFPGSFFIPALLLHSSPGLLSFKYHGNLLYGP